MKQFGIIGFPLGHSFSQKYFTDKFSQLGLSEYSYTNFPIPNIEEVKNVIKNNPSLMGFNVTIPYKQAIINYLHNTSNLPFGLHACNCVKLTDDKLIGYNTDVIGFEKSLLPHLTIHHKHALVLGNGGAAEAVKFVLNKLKINFKTVGRKRVGDIDFCYQDIDEKIINTHLLIINTTPLGTFPNIAECPEIPYQFISKKHLLYDLVYNPSETLFLQKGKANGAAIKNGSDMLVIQAEESWRIWNL
jgi:shikimate dehydrogenase